MVIPLKPYSKEREIFAIKEMLTREELRLRTIERYVLTCYLKSLQNDNKS